MRNVLYIYIYTYMHGNTPIIMSQSNTHGDREIAGACDTDSGIYAGQWTKIAKFSWKKTGATETRKKTERNGYLCITYFYSA